MKEEITTFRTSNEEKQLIKKKADEAGMTMSDYIRFSALNGTKYQVITTIEIKQCQ